MPALLNPARQQRERAITLRPVLYRRVTTFPTKREPMVMPEQKIIQASELIAMPRGLKGMLALFESRFTKLGTIIEQFPPEEGGGAYVSIPRLDFGDWGADPEEAKVNLVEKAFHVATMKKAPGEKWTPKLTATVARLRETLAR